MTANTIGAGKEADYASDTRRRMELVRQAFVCLRQGIPADLRPVICRLHEQELASQAAQFVGVAGLARNLGDHLEYVQRAQSPLHIDIVDTLLQVCRYIVLHAEAVAAGVLPHSHHARRLPTDACGAPQPPEYTDDQTGTSAEVTLRRRSRRPRTAAGEEALPDEPCFFGDSSCGVKKAACGSEQVPNRSNVVRVTGE